MCSSWPHLVSTDHDRRFTLRTYCTASDSVTWLDVAPEGNEVTFVGNVGSVSQAISLTNSPLPSGAVQERGNEYARRAKKLFFSGDTY